jgi:hypothetical protein
MSFGTDASASAPSQKALEGIWGSAGCRQRRQGLAGPLNLIARFKKEYDEGGRPLIV